MMTTPHPKPTQNLQVAKDNMDEFGYCMLADVLSAAEVSALRSRLFEQVKAEEQLGETLVNPIGKQLVKFLVNKGKVFRDLLFQADFRAVVDHVLGPEYLLSSINAHIAHPGGTTEFHRDQFWMPTPANKNKQPLIRAGAINRKEHKGHHVIGNDNPLMISPAVVCNSMWMLDDFTEGNGATILVPGSHLSGREPDSMLDTEANWVPAIGSAGSVAIFDGRTWHSTGVNVTDKMRTGINTGFCAPQFRQQENFQLGTSPEVLAEASEELLAILGFKTFLGYGGTEGNPQWVARGQYGLGELTPD
ncbi:MAG: phytanoyl-CoA dioxygenase family protein [Pseudomonadales bacterium]|nr:phytanoyl-CoA dioxygenase family protein [Pseudomonadales bacterium]